MKRKSWAIIIGLMMLTGIMGFHIQYITFDYDFESFFPMNSEETRFFEAFRDTFENDSDYALIGLENKEGIFQEDFLYQVDDLHERLEEMPFVVNVESPTRFEQLKRGHLVPSLIRRPYLNFKRPKTYKRDSIKIFNNPIFDGFLFSRDRKSVMLYVQHEPDLTNDDYKILTDTIQKALHVMEFDGHHVAGKCFGEVNFIQIIEEEVALFILVSALMMIVFLVLTYRRFWGVWMPMVVVGCTVICSVSIMILNGKSLDALSTILPTLLLVIGISDAIHLLTNYLARIKPNMNKYEALKASIKEVGVATMITSFTTMIGFLTLVPSTFLPIVDLGIYATIGLVIAFVVTYLFIPTSIYLHPPLRPRQSFKEIDKYLLALHQWVMARPKLIITSSILLLIVGIIGITQIKMNNYILEDLRASDPLRIDFDYFSEHFAGSRPFELSVSLNNPDDSVFDFEVFQELEQLENYLTDTYGIGNVLSPVVVFKNFNQIYHFGNKESFAIPENEADFDTLSQILIDNAASEDLDIYKIVTPDFKRARISAKMPDWGSYIVRQKEKDLEEFTQSNLKHINIRSTGSGYLIDLNTSYLSRNVLNGLFIAIGIISILFAFLFRSFSMVFITLVCNLLPLIITGGIMGFMGVDLKISTSIIFIISFGIAVDDSIHFLSKFRSERKKHDTATAIRNSYLSTGKAIVLTSFILVGGFLVLCLSSFLGIFYVGLLVSVTLFVALITVLTLLPVLLKWLIKDN